MAESIDVHFPIRQVTGLSARRTAWSNGADQRRQWRKPVRIRRGPATVTGEPVPTLGHCRTAGRSGADADPGARRLRPSSTALRAVADERHPGKDEPDGLA